MLEIVRPFVIVTGLVLFEAIPDVLHHDYGYDELLVKIGAGAAIVVVIWLLDFLFRRWSSIRCIRRARYSVSHLEGIWLQLVSIPERPYSISRIRYASNGRWNYEGIAFDMNFVPAAEWQSSSLHYDRTKRIWYFAGDAWLLKYDPRIASYERSARGYVSPMLEIASEKPDPTKLGGTVVDLKVAGQSGIFTISMHRADDLYPRKPPSLEDLKRETRENIEAAFVAKALKKTDAAQEIHTQEAAAGVQPPQG